VAIPTDAPVGLEAPDGSRVPAVAPAFLGIGAMKAGTTMLYEILQTLPEICMARKKEVHFFDVHYHRGLDWYRRHFECPPGRALSGEITPNYLYDARSPARIAEHYPDIRLMVCVRDPVARAYSQYKQWVRDSGYRRGFEEFVDDHPNAIERGLYAKQLSRYRRHFSSGQMHIVLFEDLIADPVPSVGAICAFLGVPPPAHLDLPDEPVHRTVRPRHDRAYVAAKRVRSALYRRDIVWPVEIARRVGAVRVLARPDATRTFPPILPATIARLREHYHADIEALSTVLGRDLEDVWTLACGPAEGDSA
jgi:hypothetical protein